MHIGKTKEDYKCNPLFIDSWKENIVEDCGAGTIRIEDTCEGEDIMEEKDEERYLGDVISNDGRNLKNIKARVNKGIVTKILAFLDGIPFDNITLRLG